jgi:hypothetical protein
MAAMRAPRNNAKGASGQSFVKGQFEELGWGAIPNPEHDLGTDLFLAVRDSRGFDGGALLGAQVKNWALPFDAPETIDGEEGWWFADTEDHFEYWLGHRVPHVLVLHDKDSKASYWVHIEKKAVVSTGKRRKIFVPKKQTVDADHADEMMRIALSPAQGETWEGSAWSPGREIPVGSQLRYALMTPRLVAPHGNASPATISSAEALALTVAVRTSELRHRYRDIQELLDSRAAASSGDARWALYAALSDYVERGSLDGLLGLDRGGVEAELRAAVIACVAAALFEESRSPEAVDIVESALNHHDDYNPVDHAWLTMHLARNLLQVGELERASKLALGVATIGRVATGDPTAGMLSGVASDLLFSLSGWDSESLAATVRSRDTAGSWWRSQAMTSGLAKHLEEAFKTWSNDQSVTFGASDQTWAKLRSASLISGHAADTPNWRYESSLLAQHVLMLEPDDSHVASALDLLRNAGAEKELKLVIGRILEYGPTEALRSIARGTDIKSSSRLTLTANLELIGLAGVILDTETADRNAGWLLAELQGPMTRAASLGVNVGYAERTVKALARLYMTCSPATQATVRDAVLRLPQVDDQSLAHEYAGLLARIDHEDWTPDQMDGLRRRSKDDNFELKDAIEAHVASRDPEFRSQLVTRIEEGDAQALGAWGDVRELPSNAVRGMIRHAAASVLNDVASARGGAYGFGGNDPLRSLVLLNTWHADEADWPPVIEAVSEPASGPNDLESGMQLMALQVERVPREVAERLRPALERLAAQVPDRRSADSFVRAPDLRGAASTLLALLFPDEVEEGFILELLGGVPAQQVAAIDIMERRPVPGDLASLALLVKSDDADVRGAVATALANRVSNNPLASEALGLLKRLLEAPGIRQANGVMRSISRQGKSEGGELILKLLEAHESAAVRYHVKVVRNRWKADPAN